MLNIDTRLIENNVLNESEFWLLMQIAKRLNAKKTAFPSNYTLKKDCGWGAEKLQKNKQSLIQKGFLKVVQRKGEGNLFTSNIYKITSKFISVFIPVDDLEMEEEESPCTDFPHTDLPHTEEPLNGKAVCISINKEKSINQKVSINKEREHTPELEKDIIIYPLNENKQDVEETPPCPPLTYETLKSELWRKAEVDGKLAAYLRNLELPLLNEKSKIVFEKVFDKWLAYQLSEKSKLNICDGTEESAIKLLHNQYKGKASIFMALNNWTCSTYSKSEAQKYMAELNKPTPTQSKAPEQLRYVQPKRQRNNDEY